MENPAEWGRASEACQLAGDTRKHTRPPFNVQALLDRGLRHHWRAEWLGSILAMRLDQRRLLMLGAGALHGLDPDLAEDLAETFLADLRAGPPPPPFIGIRAEAELWASHASRLEAQHYLVACWNVLPPEDRQRFLGVAV